MNVLFWVAAPAGAKGRVRMGTLGPHVPKGRSSASYPDRASREPCKVLYWHLSPRHTCTSVPTFGQRLRPPSESDQCRDSSPGRCPAPEGQRRMFARQQQPSPSRTSISARAFRPKTTRPWCGAGRHSTRCQAGAPLGGRPFTGGRVGAASVPARGLLCWRPADCAGTAGPEFPLGLHSAAGLCPLISP